MKIALDCDGVIRDFISSLKKTYSFVYPEHTIEDITDWDLSKFFPIGEKINSFIYSLRRVRDIFYENARPYDGVMELIESLINDGHEVFVLSAQPTKESAKWTKKWIEYYELPLKETCIVKRGAHKLRVDYDVLLDDNPETLSYIYDKGYPNKKVVCMDRPWNKNISDKIPRVSSFNEFYKLIKRGF